MLMSERQIEREREREKDSHLGQGHCRIRLHKWTTICGQMNCANIVAQIHFAVCKSFCKVPGLKDSGSGSRLINTRTLVVGNYDSPSMELNAIHPHTERDNHLILEPCTSLLTVSCIIHRSFSFETGGDI